LTPHSIERIAGTSASALSAVAKVQWNGVSPSQGRGNPCNILSLCELAVFSLSLRTICAVDLVSTGVMASGDCGGEDKKRSKMCHQPLNFLDCVVPVHRFLKYIISVHELLTGL